MLLSKRIFTIIFCCIVLLELISTHFQLFQSFYPFIKSSIVFSLIVYYLYETKNTSNKTKHLTLLALVFCVTGDILLTFVNKSENYFILGLIAFLIGHLFYIFVFSRKIALKNLQSLFTFVLVSYCIGYFMILKPHLDSLLLPVLVYMIVILLMAISAYLRKQQVTSKSFNLVLIGALLFVISDSLLAFNKFHKTFEYASFLIMLTYSFAQYFIVFGLLEQKNNMKV